MESTTQAKMSLLLEQQSFLRKELEWAKTHELNYSCVEQGQSHQYRWTTDSPKWEEAQPPRNTLYGNLSDKGVEYVEEVAQALRNCNKEVDRIYSGVANGKILLVKNGIIL